MPHARFALPTALPPSWRRPSADGTDLDVELFPSVLMLGAATLVQRQLVRPLLEGFGIGVAEWRVLISLHRFGPASSADIVNRSWMDKAQISRAVVQLERQRCLLRSSDPAHGERQILSLTPRGRALYQRVMVLARQQQAQLLGLLTEGERKALYAGLQKILRYAGGPAAADGPD